MIIFIKIPPIMMKSVTSIGTQKCVQMNTPSSPPPPIFEPELVMNEQNDLTENNFNGQRAESCDMRWSRKQRAGQFTFINQQRNGQNRNGQWNQSNVSTWQMRPVEQQPQQETEQKSSLKFVQLKKEFLNRFKMRDYPIFWLNIDGVRNHFQDLIANDKVDDYTVDCNVLQHLVCYNIGLVYTRAENSTDLKVILADMSSFVNRMRTKSSSNSCLKIRFGAKPPNWNMWVNVIRSMFPTHGLVSYTKKWATALSWTVKGFIEAYNAGQKTTLWRKVCTHKDSIKNLLHNYGDIIRQSDVYKQQIDEIYEQIHAIKPQLNEIYDQIDQLYDETNLILLTKLSDDKKAEAIAKLSNDEKAEVAKKESLLYWYLPDDMQTELFEKLSKEEQSKVDDRDSELKNKEEELKNKEEELQEKLSKLQEEQNKFEKEHSKPLGLYRHHTSEREKAQKELDSFKVSPKELRKFLKEFIDRADKNGFLGHENDDLSSLNNERFRKLYVMRIMWSILMNDFSVLNWQELNRYSNLYKINAQFPENDALSDMRRFLHSDDIVQRYGEVISMFFEHVLIEKCKHNSDTDFVIWILGKHMIELRHVLRFAYGERYNPKTTGDNCTYVLHHYENYTFKSYLRSLLNALSQNNSSSIDEVMTYPTSMILELSTLVTFTVSKNDEYDVIEQFAKRYVDSFDVLERLRKNTIERTNGDPDLYNRTYGSLTFYCFKHHKSISIDNLEEYVMHNEFPIHGFQILVRKLLLLAKESNDKTFFNRIVEWTRVYKESYCQRFMWKLFKIKDIFDCKELKPELPTFLGGTKNYDEE